MEAGSEPSRILVVDDDAVDREAVSRELRQTASDQTIESVGNAEAALERLRRRTYVCAFIDQRMPGRSGLELLQQIQHEGLTTPVVILTGCGDELFAVEAIKAGAADYLPKSHLNTAQLGRCLESARRILAGRSEAQCRLDCLTPRERQVMALLVEGKSNKLVAAELGISRRTVESHRAHIMDKLQVHSLAELVRCVLESGSPPP